MGLLFSLLTSNPLALLLVVVQLFLTTAFFPFQVGRPLKRVPTYTYSLLGINVVVFLFTVFVANINLPLDKVEGQKAMTEILAKEGNGEPPAAPAADAPGAASNTANNAANNATNNAANNAADNKASDNAADDASEEDKEAAAEAKAASAKRKAESDAVKAAAARKNQALSIAWKKADTPAGFKRAWQIQHSDASYVLEPHYSAQNIFGYSPGRPTPWGLIGSLFLHATFFQLAGSLLYLWVFGRALEETLGKAVFAGAYLVCGIASTLLYHVITKQFAPGASGVPFIGASGAIAGVLGLFALRYYRTPAKFWSAGPTNVVIVLLISVIGGVIGSFLMALFGNTLVLAGFFGGFLAAWFGYLFSQRKTAFSTANLPTRSAVGIWVAAFNVLPALGGFFSAEASGGTAHWAHIGGVGFGMLYATLIGSKGEGALEYALEDAHKAFESGNMDAATEQAESLLEREPGSAGAFEVMAKSHDARGNENEALDNYEIAIQRYLQSGERDEAVKAYQHALIKNPSFILEPKIQFALANQMAKNFEYEAAAENLAKIPFTFPDAPEGEISLLRAAQLYIEHLNQTDMGVHLLNTMLERYPETQWMVQVQRVMKMADYKTRSEAEALETPVSLPPTPPANTRPQAQSPQIKK